MAVSGGAAPGEAGDGGRGGRQGGRQGMEAGGRRKKEEAQLKSRTFTRGEEKQMKKLEKKQENI